MSDFVIIPDSSSDLTKELRERFDIPDYVRGILYCPDGSQMVADLDWETIDPKTFYESMTDKKTLYKTACTSVGDIIATYEKFLKEGKDILAVCLSSALSGTYQACDMVARQLREKYPDRKIICIDSMRYSTALSLLVMMAAAKRDEGATIGQTAEFLEKNKHRIHQMGTMDDLFFLCKTGRISNFKAFFGTLVGVNPMADFNRHGMSEVIARVKGKKSAFDAVIKYMRKTVTEPQSQIIFVAHSNREKAAAVLADMIQKEFSPKEIIINDVGMSCGASVGPGLCAAFYVGTEISEGNEKEKAIMASVIEEQSKKGK